MTTSEQYCSPIWHPCSQMKDYEDLPPIKIKSASGSYLTTSDDKKIIDAISSWWCKSLGHGHPRLKQALKAQLEKFEHVISANTTNDTIDKLSEKICQLTNTLNKIFYAGDGSCAVEIAMKMSLHAHQLQGQSQRTQFMALQNGYHGETIATLSVSDLGLYKDPYSSLLFDANFIDAIPYVSGKDDPLWLDCSDQWVKIEPQLDKHKSTLSAILVEPIVQGAGGMLIYSQDFLKRLRRWCTKNNIHLIADEIMTGLGRTGRKLACDHAGIEADFLCLSKGLTSGWLPFSAVCTSTPIYDLFYDDYETGKAFLHSNTYTGNALAASVALETFDILEDESIYQRTQTLESTMLELMHDIQFNTKKLHNIRHIGGIIAADLITDQPRAGFTVFKEAIKQGALLRPLGNTIYWLPPLNIEVETLIKLKEITEHSIKQL